MTAEPETIVRRLIEEGFNRGEVAVCDEVTDPALVEHQDYGPGHAPGAEGVKAVIRSLRRAYPDFHLEIDHLTVDGDLVWLHMTGTGTQDGPFMGQPPTGRRMRVDVFDLVRVADGRIAEHWGVPDRLSALFQLGHVPLPTAAVVA